VKISVSVAIASRLSSRVNRNSPQRTECNYNLGNTNGKPGSALPVFRKTDKGTSIPSARTNDPAKYIPAP
jgi:hypothetical protein